MTHYSVSYLLVTLISITHYTLQNIKLKIESDHTVGSELNIYHTVGSADKPRKRIYSHN